MAILKEKFKSFANKDLEMVLKELHFPEAAYERILKISLKTAQNRLVELDRTFESKDWPLSQEIAHDLKGMFANMRIEMLSQSARELEELFKEQDKSDLARKAFELFAQKVDTFNSVFDQQGG